MKNIKKNTLKLVVLVALFASSVFADGEMGGGGRADSGDNAHGTKIVISQSMEEGEMGGGGRTEDQGLLDSIMSAIRDYFDLIS
jgi:hypothetical protein